MPPFRCTIVAMLCASVCFPLGCSHSYHYESLRGSATLEPYVPSTTKTTVKPSPYEFQKSTLGLRWDNCTHDRDCLLPRKCSILQSNGELRACKSAPGCVCDTTIDGLCTDREECHPGEFCYIPLEDSIGICISRNVWDRINRAADFETPKASHSPSVQEDALAQAHTKQDHVVRTSEPGFLISSTDDDTEMENELQSGAVQTGAPKGGRFCIGIDALKGWARSELVFEKDEEAMVLCDVHGSCATPGHVVVANGTAMMMSSYCKGRQCNAGMMLVNNPKYRKGLRIRSKTAGLMFTSYSARYETHVEELVFRVLTKLRF